jgi:ArsR family transcriptional regulator, arsenate/arsenite/antimonite-responsive transcriptional repressor
MADIFEVIADPTRRQILEALLAAQAAGGELQVNDLVKKTKLGQPAVSKHLKILRDAKLVAAREDGQKRFYSVTPEPLEEIEDWVINFLSLGFDAEEEEDLAGVLGDAGAKLGTWLTERASWLTAQAQAKVKELDLDVDPKDLGRQLGRRLAEAKVETEKSAKEFEKLARQTLDEVVKDVTAEANKVAKTVKTETKKVVKGVKTEAKKVAKDVKSRVKKS